MGNRHSDEMPIHALAVKSAKTGSVDSSPFTKFINLFNYPREHHHA